MEFIQSSSNVEQQISLPLLITICFSCIIFRYIVRPFNGIETPEINVVPPFLTPDQTLNQLESLGLGYLTYDGNFCTIILAYLFNLGNLTADLDISTLDPGVLIFMLERLKFLIANHELIFDVLSKFVDAFEVYDLDIDYDPELFQIAVRNAGNDLFSLYRNIERELNLVTTDLPIH